MAGALKPSRLLLWTMLMQTRAISGNLRVWPAILLGLLLVTLVAAPASMGMLLAFVLSPLLLLGLIPVPQSTWLPADLSSSIASATFLGSENFQRPPPTSTL